MLIITAAVAGYFGGHNRGYNEGLNQWKSMPQTLRSYYVGDLIAKPTPVNPVANYSPGNAAPTLTQLASEIERNVIPDNWKPEQSDWIRTDTNYKSLIVSGNSLVHAEISNYLDYLRKEHSGRKSGINELIDDRTDDRNNDRAND